MIAMIYAIDRRRRRWPAFIFLAALFLAVNLPAPAALVAFDTFISGKGDYSDGFLVPVPPAPGQSSESAIGFRGKWGGASTAWLQANSAQGLNMTGLSPAGGAVTLSPTNNGDYSRFVYRTFLPADGDGPFWFGMLYQPDDNTLNKGATAMIGFLTGQPPSTADDAVPEGATWTTANGGSLGGFALGVSAGTAKKALDIAYQSNAGGGSGTVTVASSGFTLTAGTTYFVIANLIINSPHNETLNVWVKTSVPAHETDLGKPTWTIASADMLSSAGKINTVALYAGCAVATGGPTAAISSGTTVDDITVATTYAELLTAAPKTPGVAMAGGAGVLAALVCLLVRR